MLDRRGGGGGADGEMAAPCRAVPAASIPTKAAVAMLLMRGEGETPDGSIPAFTSGGMETGEV